MTSWKQTGKDVTLDHCPDHEEIGLWYARRYTARESFNYSETNNLIQNFKKPVDRPAQELQYKKSAIDKFIGELRLLLKNKIPSRTLYLVPVPCSKSNNHVLYDDRIDQVTKAVGDPDAKNYHFPVLRRVVDSEGLHSGEVRDPQATFDALEIDENVARIYQPDSTILLIDDVLTTGSTFMGCRNKLLAKFPDARIRGVFWAKSEYRDLTELLAEFDIEE